MADGEDLPYATSKISQWSVLFFFSGFLETLQLAV